MSNTMTEYASIRVAIIEDDPILQAYLADTVKSTSRLRVAWRASSLAEARQKLVYKPDIALVDLGLPDGSGADLIANLDEMDIKSIAVTIFDDRRSVLKALESGAQGYLVKDSTAEEIVSAVETVVSGGAPISETAAIHLIQLARQRSRGQSEVQTALTPRETELLQLFARGLSYRKAAETLGIKVNTVNDYVKSIYQKLSVNSKSEAVYEAIQQKLIRFDE